MRPFKHVRWATNTIGEIHQQQAGRRSQPVASESLDRLPWHWGVLRWWAWEIRWGGPWVQAPHSPPVLETSRFSNRMSSKDPGPWPVACVCGVRLLRRAASDIDCSLPRCKPAANLLPRLYRFAQPSGSEIRIVLQVGTRSIRRIRNLDGLRPAPKSLKIPSTDPCAARRNRTTAPRLRVNCAT